VPHCLELLDPDPPVEDNLKSLLASGLIFDGAGALLRDQLSEPKEYVSLSRPSRPGSTPLTSPGSPAWSARPCPATWARCAAWASSPARCP
jgi:hypothetical protein